MAPYAIVLLVTSLSLVQAFRTRPQRHYLKQALAVELTSGVGLWQQCGGKGWAGPTRCDSGLVCKFTNEWYSQCEPGAGGDDGSDSDLGCCKFGSTCADCGNDGTGWCHKSASNCETCTGSFDASAAAPICHGDVDHGDDDRDGSDFEKGPGVVKKYGRLQVKGGKLVDKDGHQVYLKGMSFFWSMWTADYWTAENVRVMARQWNVSVLRAAVGVTDHDPSNDVRGNPALNHRLLETVVNACIEEGIYVIIDWHDHDAHLHQSEAIAFFEKYGKMYGDKENILWETWNEPNAVSSGISWWEHCKPYHEKVVPVIRKYSENVIILGSPDWSRKVDDAARDPVKGDNLAYALHFYTNYHKQDIRDVADWALQHGVAIFVSEWGLWNSACTSVPCDISYLDNADEGDRWMQWCDRNRVSWVAWAIYDKAETPAITKQRGVFTDSALTPAGKYYKRQILR